MSPQTRKSKSPSRKEVNPIYHPPDWKWWIGSLMLPIIIMIITVIATFLVGTGVATVNQQEITLFIFNRNIFTFAPVNVTTICASEVVTDAQVDYNLPPSKDDSTSPFYLSYTPIMPIVVNCPEREVTPTPPAEPTTATAIASSTALPTATATQLPTSTPTPEQVCCEPDLIPTSQGCSLTVVKDGNLRTGPGTANALNRATEVGETLIPEGYVGIASSRWYKTNQGWIKYHLVEEVGDCSGLPRLNDPILDTPPTPLPTPITVATAIPIPQSEGPVNPPSVDQPPVQPPPSQPDSTQPSVVVIAPTSIPVVPSSGKAPEGMNLATYCRVTYGDGMSDTPDPETKTGWICTKDGVSYPIDMNDACRVLFGGNYPVAKLGSADNYWAWWCWSS